MLCGTFCNCEPWRGLDDLGWRILRPRIEGQRKGMERKKWYFLMWPGALGKVGRRRNNKIRGRGKKETGKGK